MYPYRRQPNNPYDKARENNRESRDVSSKSLNSRSFNQEKRPVSPAPAISEFTLKAQEYYKFGSIKTDSDKRSVYASCDDYDNPGDTAPPNQPPMTEPDTDNSIEEINRYIIQMVTEAIKDEMEDSRFYSTIANTLEDENDSKIFYKIACDEKKHEKIFSEIYEMLTGESFSDDGMDCDKKPISDNMAENFSNALFGELSAVEFYRKLYFAFLNPELRDALFEIITDEQGHAQILNYMYSKYSE